MLTECINFREQSQKLLNEAEEIKTSLNITNEKQKEASDAIDTAWRDYEQVESRLYEVQIN